MKKVLSLVLIFIILTNFIFTNPAYAADNVSGNTFDQSNYDDLSDDGTIPIETENGEQEASVADSGPSVIGTIVGYIAKIVNAVPMMAQLLITAFLNMGGIIEANATKEDIRHFQYTKYYYWKIFSFRCKYF